MIVSLHVEYQTQWGAQLYLTKGLKPKFGQLLPKDAVDMDNDGRGNWFVEVDATYLVGGAYHYVLAYQRHVVRNEFGDGHCIAGLATLAAQPYDAPPTLRVWDVWRRLPQIRSFFSLAFRQMYSQRRSREGYTLQAAPPVLGELLPNHMTVVCEAGHLQDNWTLALIGSLPELGAWDPSKALIMEQISRQLWSVSLNRKNLRFPLRYKFVVLEKGTHEFVAWEDCTNRYFEPSVLDEGDSILLCDQRLNMRLTRN